MTEPMSDERLAEGRAIIDGTHHAATNKFPIAKFGPENVSKMFVWAGEAYDEIRRLRAEVEAHEESRHG